MSEAFTGSTNAAPGTEADFAEPAGPQTELTGHPLVEEMLVSLDALEQLPVAEHVAVFESAHHRLREALADPDPG